MIDGRPNEAHPAWARWSGIIQRHGRESLGWASFAEFARDCWPPPADLDDPVLHRIDDGAPYSARNVAWLERSYAAALREPPRRRCQSDRHLLFGANRLIRSTGADECAACRRENANAWAAKPENREAKNRQQRERYAETRRDAQ